MSGDAKDFGQWLLQGSQTAIADINANGGINGRQVNFYLGDTRGTAVDAVPATREVLTHSPSVLFGGTSLEFTAMQPIVDSAHLPTMALLPSVQFDSLRDQYVYRTNGSDSDESKAMVYYALQKGLTQCALLLDNSANSQSYVKPVTAALEAHGGKIVANIQLVPHATSYRSELVQLFRANPQCVFTDIDTQTTTTLFANAKQLGYLKVPFIGSLKFSSVVVANAIGLNEFSQWVTGMAPLSVSGPAKVHFDSVFKTKFNQDAGPYQALTYDSTIAVALAMTAAGSTDPSVWPSKLLDVTNPPGEAVFNYADGVKLLKQGKKINFEGAASSVDFANHVITTGYQVVTFDTAGATKVVAQVPASAIANL
jgi:branched-chain amino acid transport system substrate-binding protein